MTEPVPAEANELLQPAFTAAHQALRRMEEDDVPAPLQPVRAASKKNRLPAPLRKLLARYLEEGWLRALALEQLEGAGLDVDASRLFLERPEGWHEELEEMRRLREMRQMERAIEALRVERDHYRKLNDELTARLAGRDVEVERLERSLQSDDRLEALRRRLAESSKELAHLQERLAARDAEITRLSEELAEADERIATLRTRSFRPPSGAVDGGGSRTFGRGNPLESARLLDSLIEAMRPLGGAPQERDLPPPLALPPGVRPDSPSAIDWIMTIDRKVTLVVDGHNVAHDLSPEPGRTARDRVVSEVARLRRLANGPLAAVVFFDTDQEPETHTNFGVSVRYVPDADAAIAALAAEVDHETIVVSTDKEVRERSAAHGAIALWGTAFSSWIRRR